MTGFNGQYPIGVGLLIEGVAVSERRFPLDREPFATIREDQYLVEHAVGTVASVRSVRRLGCRSRSDLGGSVWIADRAYLIGVALTTSPASFEARPLSFMRGDVRQSLDRFGWPCS